MFALLHDVVQELSITRFIIFRWVNFHNFLRRRSPETALSNRHLGEHVCCRGILCLKRRSAFTFTRRRYEVLFLLSWNLFFETQFRCQQPHPIDSQDTHMLVSKLKPDFMIQNHAMRIAHKTSKTMFARDEWVEVYDRFPTKMIFAFIRGLMLRDKRNVFCDHSHSRGTKTFIF